jgi:protein ImuA
MLVLRTTNEADAVWAFDQALRCPGVGAVWGAWDRLDVRDFRRLQLAAETSGTIGLLIRPARLRGQPTWAEVKFEVRRTKYEVRKRKKNISSFVLRRSSFSFPPWRLCVELVRCRGATGEQKVVLELDEMSGEWKEVSDEPSHWVSVFAELADSTGARRA